MKTFDKLGLIAEKVTTDVTASTTAVKIDGLNIGEASYICEVNVLKAAGTDATNYFTLQVEVGDSLGGTFVPLGNAIKVPLEGGKFEVGFTASQADTFFRVTATEAGDGSSITYTAFVSRA